MNQLGIFLLSYNRPEFILEAINSILNQSFTHFDLIISDNSSNDEVQTVIGRFNGLPNVKLLRRQPSLDSIAHFNQILSEAQIYNYFMMFHDDDLMLPNCVETLMTVLKNNPESAAACCNAFNKFAEPNAATLFNPYYKNDFVVQNSKTLINRYLTKTLSHPPFPFYIYNTEKVGSLKMDPALGGKHCDVSFLCEVANRGSLYWVAAPLGEYRRHENNDSNFVNLADLFSLSRFVFNRYHSFYFKMSFILTKRTLSYLITLFRKNFILF